MQFTSVRLPWQVWKLIKKCQTCDSYVYSCGFSYSLVSACALVVKWWKYRVIFNHREWILFYYDSWKRLFFLVKRKYFDDLEHATRIQKRRLNLLFSYQFKYYSCFQKLIKTIRYLWHKKTRIWVIFRYSSKAIYIK